MEINVLGFGVMGKQIAALLQLLGHDIRVWTRNPSPDAQSRFALVSRLVKRRIATERVPGTIEFESALPSLPACLTIETLAEDLDAKRSVVATLTYRAGDVDIFSNTSSFSPAQIATGVHGLHFFNPIHSVLLVELSTPRETLSAQAKNLIADLENVGFDVLETGANAGYVANYVLFHEISGALKLVDQHGYRGKTIDRIQSKLGRTVSVFDVIDLIGIDVTKGISENLHAIDPAFYVSPTLERAIAQGILGSKNKTSIRKLIEDQK